MCLEDLASYDEMLADKLKKQPTEHLPLVGIYAHGVDIKSRALVYFILRGVPIENLSIFYFFSMKLILQYCCALC